MSTREQLRPIAQVLRPQLAITRLQLAWDQALGSYVLTDQVVTGGAGFVPDGAGGLVIGTEPGGPGGVARVALPAGGIAHVYL